MTFLLQFTFQFVLVQSIPGLNMTFAGTTDPCASVKLTSIGKVGEHENRVNAPVITEFLESTLKIPKDRYDRQFY